MLEVSPQSYPLIDYDTKYASNEQKRKIPRTRILSKACVNYKDRHVIINNSRENGIHP